MLKARWSGYEIDSSEAAYDAEVPEPEKLGTLVRGLLGSGYFTRSYALVFEEPFIRLHNFIAAKDEEDKLTARALGHLEKQIDRFNPDRITTIGVRAIEAILNYVGVHRKELLEDEVFRFELEPEQQEMYEDYDYEFEPGQMVDETKFYSEEEIPLDGVVLYLGCSLAKLTKLPPDDQPKARRIATRIVRESGLSDFGFFGRQRDYVEEGYDRPKPLSLRVRLNTDATFAVTGRWFDDGQFDYPYYEFILKQAAKKSGAKMDFTMIY